MTDLARLRLYYQNMSAEELVDSAGEGVDAYVPETWAVIGSELEKRHLEPSPPEMVVLSETESALQPPALAASRRFKTGVNTAYVLSAYLVLLSMERIIQRASIA